MNKHNVMNLSNANRSLYLVKVPKYIANAWEKAPNDATIGKLTIKSEPNKEPQISLLLSQEDPALGDILTENRAMNLSLITEQILGVFSCTEIEDASESHKSLAMEGKLTQKLEFQPNFKTSYLKLKSEVAKQSLSQVRVSKQLEKPVQAFNPIANHKNNIEYNERKKLEGKHVRNDKEVVLETLFAAFEKHQYYNLRDLVTLTQQPVIYLKEILREVCNYNLKLPHKNTWELKPEFRHYKGDTKENF